MVRRRRDASARSRFAFSASRMQPGPTEVAGLDSDVVTGSAGGLCRKYQTAKATATAKMSSFLM